MPFCMASLYIGLNVETEVLPLVQNVQNVQIFSSFILSLLTLRNVCFS